MLFACFDSFLIFNIFSILNSLLFESLFAAPSPWGFLNLWRFEVGFCLLRCLKVFAHYRLTKFKILWNIKNYN
ncbi:hypothetical protein FGO68_gene13994 [Halteria grandinella]|uniref:Uncharacterized protein n=1 Tax=Halteria grandinella TaxID=5974 RepID=A0A8J8T0D0_HALGN|nr:hypothetical protein FGO68_gene13994 [Halteria grandinella]